MLNSSTLQKQEIGTIQGSKLGPRFFDIVMRIFLKDESEMYADDATVAYVGSDLNELFEKLIDWCRFNKLALNPIKCEHMLLSNKHVVHQPNIHLNGDLMKKSQ